MEPRESFLRRVLANSDFGHPLGTPLLTYTCGPGLSRRQVASPDNARTLTQSPTRPHRFRTSSTADALRTGDLGYPGREIRRRPSGSRWPFPRWRPGRPRVGLVHVGVLAFGAGSSGLV